MMRRRRKARLVALALTIVAAGAILALAQSDGSVIYEGETLRSWRWHGQTDLPDQYFALLLDPSDLELARLALPQKVWSEHGAELTRWAEDEGTAAVVAYLGEAPTGGYGISVRQLRVDGAGARQVVTVVVDRRSPAPGEFVTMAVTYPVDIVPVPTAKLPAGTFTVRFVDGQGHVLAQQRLTRVAETGSGGSAGAAEAADAGGQLRVTGYGEVTTAPDRATVGFSVVGRDETAPAAQQAMNGQLAAVLRALDEFGLPDSAVRTQQFSLNPRWRYEDGQSFIVGYEARTQLEVQLDELDRLGALVQTLVNAGVTEVSQIRYGLQDVRSVQEAALRQAAADARWRAEALAAALGQRITGIVEVYDQSRGTAQPTPYPVMRAALAMDEALAPEFPPDELTVRAEVVVVFRIAGQ